MSLLFFGFFFCFFFGASTFVCNFLLLSQHALVQSALINVSSLLAVSTHVSSSATTGPVHTGKERICLTNDNSSMHCIFNKGRSLTLKVFQSSALHVARNTNSYTCLHLQPKRNYYYGVGFSFLFFLYNNLYTYIMFVFKLTGKV